MNQKRFLRRIRSAISGQRFATIAALDTCLKSFPGECRFRRSQTAAKIIAVSTCITAIASTGVAFEGRILAVTTQGGQPQKLIFTVGANFERVELTATNWPNPVDI
jgi:hypothetical protein